MKEVMWKRAKAKKPLIKILDISEGIIFLYKEVDNKIYIRCAHQQLTIKKSELKTHINPIVTDGKIEEVSPELSHYLDEVQFKKKK